MGGELNVDSDEGAGAAFYFTLDLPRAQAVKAAEDIPPPDTPLTRETTQTPRVLVVDDNPINTMVVVEVMEGIGFEAEMALNG